MINNNNDYQNQKLRGLKRKFEAMQNKGGKCEICGYDKNISALEFHHIDPTTKEFQIDLRHFSNTNLEKLQNELDKCILICANCHRELHNPQCEQFSVKETIKQAENKKSFSNKAWGNKCPVCGNSFKKVTGKKFCSKECRKQYEKSLYPSKEIINTLYLKLQSWEKVAKELNTTRRVIQRIRKQT